VEWVRFQLGPRDPRAAARTAAWIYLVCSAVVVGSNLSLPVSGGHGARLVALGIPVPLLAFGALMGWPGFKRKEPFLILTPFIGVGVIVFLDLVTNDASAGAQVVFCLPVLFAASQLRFLGAILATLCAIAGDVIVVVELQPNSVGALDVVDVTLVACLMTGLLVLAGRRQDRLVALLESQASQDPLTGLVTRRVLDEAVQRALSMPPEHAGTALILVDVDHFKSINDTHGHPIGDDALVHVAKLLARHARPDTVISRLGGDEIAVLLPNCPEPVARVRAHEFLSTVHESPLALPDGGLLWISISVGVAHAPSGTSQLRELYAAADASLYEAKRAGRGRVGRSDTGPASTYATIAEPAGSQGFVDRPFEVRDVPDGKVEGDLGLTGDDRIDHR
jgi:diguanylate cyclase (GGDEF)-like protein